MLSGLFLETKMTITKEENLLFDPTDLVEENYNFSRYYAKFEVK